jgi:ribose transport system substrate-binding protein
MTACTGNTPRARGRRGGGGPRPLAPNDEAATPFSIGVLRPGRRPRLDGRHHRGRPGRGRRLRGRRARVAEGTNDVSTQISQVETFINDGVDAIVLLPFDGAALTPVALQAMEAGIPVINVDREFNSPFAARATVLGDNYGMGVSAGQYICEQVGDQPDAVVAEIAGIDSLPLTQDRSQGFADALAECGLDVDNRVAAELHRRVGEEDAANLLQAAPQIDASWNHDDDQGVGCQGAIGQRRVRDEFSFMVGRRRARPTRCGRSSPRVGARGDGHLPATQGPTASAARLIAQDKSLSTSRRASAADRARRPGRHRRQRRPVLDAASSPDR